MALPLQNVRVLVVEDDPIIGLDLQQTLEVAGALVLGPTHDVPAAIALLETSRVDLAVLDNLIVGGDSLPISDFLAQRGVAFLFHTSHRGELRKHYPSVPIIDKPSRPGELVKVLQTLLGRSG